MTINIEEMAVFCKKKGFVFSNSEIYGGLSGFFDFGPLGVELNNKIKQSWWKTFVQDSDNIVGIDGAIVSSKKIWKASGHLDSFADILIECKKCNSRHRADHLIEEQHKVNVEGMSIKDIENIVKDKGLKCSRCGSEELNSPSAFNLMFKTFVGPNEDDESVAYLRGETAQIIFADFKNVLDTSRVKLPFGIAQTGKAFRNEISPREFLFRVREFEQMEIEFFTHPGKVDDCPLIKKYLDLEINVYSAKSQEESREHKKIKVSDLLKLRINKWQAYWLVRQYLWFTKELGINPENLRVREHLQEELAHYARSCFDLDYKFPMGWREIYGNADRGQFDLTKHQEHSGKKLEYFDEDTQEKVIPRVASEPSQGVGRAFLALMFDAYNDDKERGNIVLKLSPKIVPFFCAVFPLVKNKPEIVGKAKEVYDLIKTCYPCFYDETSSVGRRYARADEIGVAFCITIDFESLDDDCVTIRDRNTTKQERVKISELRNKLFQLYIG
ncbi:MAG: glycine--tRNA ligase [Nanoarchaeota archaeon]|nr:glycine--tRNA ligase [Nanoarchaeota archaeon]MBU1632225.1 glycine--tRNA ligase [Nanoarchaeota archaeon]MBU1875809.1 glycine--tRNA ligase [Nanoarchaeota archaeon]